MASGRIFAGLGARSDTKRIVTLFSFAVILAHVIGLLLLRSPLPQHMVQALVTTSGLLLLTTVPGVMYAVVFFPDQCRLSTVLVLGVALNLLAYPLVLLTITFTGNTVSAATIIFSISAVTLFATICLYKMEKPPDQMTDARSTIHLLLFATLGLMVLMLVFSKPLFSDINRYLTEKSLRHFVDSFGADDMPDRVSAENDHWLPLPDGSLKPVNNQPRMVYFNESNYSQRFSLRLLTNLSVDSVQIHHQAGDNAPLHPPKQLSLAEHRFPRSIYFTRQRLEELFGHADRVILSDEFDLAPGKNVFRFTLSDDTTQRYVDDLSTLSRLELTQHLRAVFLVRTEPYIGDAGEVFFESTNALTTMNLNNPPIVYLAYHGALAILGASIAAINSYELTAFLFVFIVLSLIMRAGADMSVWSFAGVGFLVLAVYSSAISFLPLVHTAGGIFLLMFLSGTWFLWIRQWGAAALCLSLCMLIRYEGAILVLLSLVSFHIVSGRVLTLLKLLPFLIGVIFLVLWLVEDPVGLLNMQERLGMISLTDTDASLFLKRAIRYAGWFIVLSCGMPVFWLFYKKKDAVSSYYLLITGSYFIFLSTLSYIRPYHLGPIVLTAAVVGARSLLNLKTESNRKWSMVGVFLLSIVCIHLILNRMPPLITL